MRVFLLLSLFWIPVALAHGQMIKKGQLLDLSDSSAIAFAHIRNLSTDLGTTSSFQGKFQMIASAGDSLWISMVGYRSIGLIVTPDFLDRPFWRIYVERDTVMLDEVVIHELPSEESFRQQVLEYQSVDTSFQLFGIPSAGPTENKLLNEKVIKSPLFALAHPVSFLYYNTSKKEKEKRKMHKIRKNADNTRLIEQKFNRDFVAELTKLEGDKLTYFIAYCNFSEEFILKNTKFRIAEVIQEKLVAFENEYQG
ncbi:MAG: hypothetical protein KI790_20245 [Cyclobacteriaceae bacterium]|nr:hypothetical protein [Cyclobacteriaceae bacterium HetDA_MAG_MS6]